MLTETDSFFIAKEDHGHFLRVYVPGDPHHISAKKVIRWRGEPKYPPYFKIKAASKVLKRKLAKEGLLDDLPQESIPGYSVNYPYDVQFMATRKITPQLNDLIYVRNDVFYLLNRTLWHPLLKLMQENIKNYDYIRLELPQLPQLVTEDVVQSWYEANQLAAHFWHSLDKLTKTTTIQIDQDEQKTILRLKNHPFVNQPILPVQIWPEQSAGSKELTPAELSVIKRQVLERDVYFLKGLTDTQRKKLVYGINPHLDASYHLHWIQWPSLNGEQKKENAIIVSSNIRDMYQYAIKTPLEQFLKDNKQQLIDQGNPIILELPVPRNTYRPKPVKKIKMKRQNRRHLDRSLKKSIVDRTYTDE